MGPIRDDELGSPDPKLVTEEEFASLLRETYRLIDEARALSERIRVSLEKQRAALDAHRRAKR